MKTNKEGENEIEELANTKYVDLNLLKYGSWYTHMQITQ